MVTANRKVRKNVTTTLEFFELKRAIEADVILGDEGFRLRVEITRSRRRRSVYRANIWATEYFRIQSTSPSTDGKPAHEPSDELLWVNWTSILRRYFSEAFNARSTAAAEAIVLADVLAWVHHSLAECSGKEHTWGECPERPREG
jgi:hypothetical protein